MKSGLGLQLNSTESMRKHLLSHAPLGWFVYIKSIEEMILYLSDRIEVFSGIAWWINIKQLYIAPPRTYHIFYYFYPKIENILASFTYAGAPTPGWTLFNQQFLTGAPTSG